MNSTINLVASILEKHANERDEGPGVGTYAGLAAAGGLAGATAGGVGGQLKGLGRLVDKGATGPVDPNARKDTVRLLQELLYDERLADSSSRANKYRSYIAKHRNRGAGIAGAAGALGLPLAAAALNRGRLSDDDMA